MLSFRRIRQIVGDFAESDSQRLYWINKIGNHDRLAELSERRQIRARENQIIVSAQLAGRPVAVITSGMDCDGGQWSGDVRWVTGEGHPSLRAAVDDYIYHSLSWADGPMNFYVATDKEAAQAAYVSRDLALEAHEDGHDWVLTP
jgi:hypothetical protein